MGVATVVYNGRHKQILYNECLENDQRHKLTVPRVELSSFECLTKLVKMTDLINGIANKDR